MLILIIVLVLLFGVGGGWATRGNEQYGWYGGSGIGIGTVLIILFALYLLGVLRF